MPRTVSRRTGPLGDPDRYLTGQELLVKQYLALALQQFTASVIGTRVIYRFATETPDLFCNAGLALLLESDSSPAVRYMTSLLLKQPDLLGIVTDPVRFNKPDAQALFMHLTTFDPGLDIRLAKYLQIHQGDLKGPFNDLAAERALDILDLASPGRRIVQILNFLMEHPNPRIASKATLVIGRRIQNVDWAEKQLLNQEDPRRRANAIEAIWGIDTDQARRLMVQNAHDQNNRVAGNSTYGLYVVGDPRSHVLARQMASDTDPAFRWTAAWVMGQIGDPQFLGPLQDLVKDDCPGVKTASLRSLVNIRREQARVEALNPRIRSAGEVTEDQEKTLDSLAEGKILIPDMQLSLNGKHVATRISR